MTCLKKLCFKIGSGATPRGGKDSYQGGDYALIRSQNVLDWEFTRNGLAYINDEQASRLDAVRIQSGDILLNITGDSVARACLVPTGIHKARVNQHVCIIRPDLERLDNVYLLMFLENKKSELLQIASSGATRNALTKGFIESLEIQVPPIDDQLKIATPIRNINLQIDNLNKANGHLLDMLMIGYRQLVASIGSYGYIEDLGTVIGGATPSKKRTDFFTSAGISWITPRDLSNSSNVFIAHGATDITDEGYRSCSTKLMPAGSVLFSSRAPVGYVAISSKEVCTNQGFKSVVPFDDIGMAFVFCFLKDNAKEIEKTGSGTTFTEVSGKAMKNFSAPIPSDKQAQQFGSYAEPLLAAIQNNENEIMRLEQIRDTLLPKLMSGEIDVSKVELPTPPEQAQTSTNGRLLEQGY